MKREFLAIMLVAFTFSVAAQNPKGHFSVKPMTGLNISHFGSPAYDVYKAKCGFIGGAEVEYSLNNWLGLSLGLMYSQQGAKIEGGVVMYDATSYSVSELKGKLKCSYLNLPIMANIYIPGVKGLSVKAGVQIGFLTSDKIEEEVNTVIVYPHEDLTPVIVSPEDMNRYYSYSVSGTDVCKSVDFGIPVGISYEYKNITLDARYYFGLIKIDKTDEPDTARNRCLSITLGYRFHL